MKVVVMANSNTFQILKAEGCPKEFKASGGWNIDGYYEGSGLMMNGTLKQIRLFASDYNPDTRHGYEIYLQALTALHEMVYQPKQTFSDDGSIVTMEHGKFRIEEWAGDQIVFQVLEMDEEFRCKQDMNNHHNVCSSCEPDLVPNIWLRGTIKSLDYKIIPSYRMKRSEIITALRDWDQNWEGWKKKTPTLAECCKYGSLETGGVFVFESEVM